MVLLWLDRTVASGPLIMYRIVPYGPIAKKGPKQSIHAEEALIRKLVSIHGSHNIKKANLVGVVVNYNRCGTLKNSAPCKSCQKWSQRYNIKWINS